MGEQDWLELYRAALYGLLAVLGGFVSYLCNTTEFSIKMFLIKGFSSGFAGFLIGLLCIYFELPNTVSFCISGTFGYLGAEVTIALLKKTLLKHLEKKI